jgi:hypothetical protein
MEHIDLGGRKEGSGGTFQHHIYGFEYLLSLSLSLSLSLNDKFDSTTHFSFLI